MFEYESSRHESIVLQPSIPELNWNDKTLYDASNTGDIDFMLYEISEANSLFAIKKASEVIPQWFRDIDVRSDDVTLTAKRCTPLLDAFTAGYVMVNTKDIHINRGLDGTISITVDDLPENTYLGSHPLSQIGTMAFGNEYVQKIYKWANFWVIKTPPNISCLFMQPVNRPDLPFHILSGIVDTDKFFNQVSFPFLLKNNFYGTVPAGTPIVQIIPFRREGWRPNIFNKMSTKLNKDKAIMTKKYMDSMFEGGKAIGGIYKKFFRDKKHY